MDRGCKVGHNSTDLALMHATAKQTNVRPCMLRRSPWVGRMLEEVGEAGAKVRGAAGEVAPSPGRGL